MFSRVSSAGDLEPNGFDHYRLIGGSFTLALGLYLYIADRSFVPFFEIPVDSLPLLPNIGPDWLTGSLPSFLHSFSFCLLTGGVLNAGSSLTSRICWSWGILHLVLEMAQIKAIGLTIADFIRSWSFDVQLVKNIEFYFRQGVFDPFDIVAAVGGCMIAYYVSQKIYAYQKLNQ